jgi:uncharacterized protein (TIGR00106 family)
MSPVKGSKVMAEFSIAPLGQKGTSISRYVALALMAIEGVEGLRYELTPMGTILEAENLETILKAVKIAHEALIAKGVLRIESTLRIDDRRDKSRKMIDKVNAVKKYMK